MSNSERILVVDEISDTAEVLQAVLEPRGVTVNRVRRLDQHSPSVNERPPAVIVLNAESFDVPGEPLLEAWRDVPQVIIGMVRTGASDARGRSGPSTCRRMLHKPFQFTELIQAIESLIARPTHHG